VYVTVYNTNPPILFNIEKGSHFPLASSASNDRYSRVATVFNHGDKFYGISWAANSPMSTSAKIIMTDGHSIYESRTFPQSPDYLGTLGDYLFFNVDRVFARKSELLGIKYK